MKKMDAKTVIYAAMTIGAGIAIIGGWLMVRKAKKDKAENYHKDYL
jgi:hypothetical protein